MRSLHNGKLFISSLPSLKKLLLFYDVYQVRQWINVSGIDINQIYPEQGLSGYSISQHHFPDIFTDGELLADFSGLEQITARHYESLSELNHRQAFFAAVKTLVVQLENQVPTVIFCHRGLARSPLVAAAALSHFHDESLALAIARVQEIHPRAYFTDISISALRWVKGQLNNTLAP